jgi:hypothetical protein
MDLWDLLLDKYKSTYLNDVILWNSGDMLIYIYPREGPRVPKYNIIEIC